METTVIKNLFTPKTKKGQRLRMSLSDEDIKKIERGHLWTAEVTDLLTNKSYKVKGAACNFPRRSCCKFRNKRGI
jgi:hypothetical protein